MNRTWRRWLWRLFKPFLLEWLEARALRLPEREREALAKRLDVEKHLIDQIEALLREQVLRTVRDWDP